MFLNLLLVPITYGLMSGDTCNFPLTEAGLVDTCNLTTNVEAYQVQPWKFNIGLNSAWLGGPPKDADNTLSGGFAMMDMSVFETLEEGKEKRGWLMTEIQTPTSVLGRCLNLQYSMAGLNVEALRLIRVDIMDLPVNNLDEDGNNGGIEGEDGMGRDMNGTDVVRREGRAKGSWEDSLNDLERVQGVMARVRSANMLGETAKLEATVVWIHSDSTGGSWQPASASYSSASRHLWIAEATPRMGQGSYRGYVAIDNLDLQEGACDNDCNFDADFNSCLWSNTADEDQFDWKVSRGSLKAYTGPTRDHSTSVVPGPAGGFAYIDSSWPQRPGDRARLVLDQPITTTQDEPLCLVFHVNMFGSGIGSLKVVQQVGGESTTLWQMVRPPSSPRDLWHRSQVTVSPGEAAATLYFEGTVGETGRGDIALDTVKFSPGPCVTQPSIAAPPGSPSGCSFNSDLCGFLSQNLQSESSAAASSPLWSRARGGGRMPQGHRAVERPDEEDWFAIFDVRNYQHRPLDRGYLIGPQISSTQTLCLGFWSYLATDVASFPYLGALQVLLIPRNASEDESSNGPKVLWSLKNQQEASWVYSQVPLSTTEPSLLAFEGTRANNVLGVIAVDDVTLFPGPCSLLPVKAQVQPRDCGFEFGFCGWRSVNPGSALPADLRPQDWQLAARGQNFGTFRDHTFGLESSGYAYFDTINIPTKTWLISPPIKEDESAFCLQFFFAAAATAGASLAVKRQYNNGTMGELWSVDFAQLELAPGEAVLGWRSAQLALPSLPSPSAIVVEGNANNGGFALDDLRLVPIESGDECETRPTQLISVDSVRTSGHIFSFIGASRSPRVLGESVARKLNEFRRKALPRTQQRSDPIVFE